MVFSLFATRSSLPLASLGDEVAGRPRLDIMIGAKLGSWHVVI
jgi:hypothetical protein